MIIVFVRVQKLSIYVNQEKKFVISCSIVLRSLLGRKKVGKSFC